MNGMYSGWMSVQRDCSKYGIAPIHATTRASIANGETPIIGEKRMMRSGFGSVEPGADASRPYWTESAPPFE